MGHLRRGGALAAVLTLLLAGAAPASAAGPDRYRNPVSAGFADTFADPVVVRGDDGLWYAFGTSDPLREGEGRTHRVPIARSADLVDWTYAGDAFAPDQRPAYAAPGAAFWAPDVRRVAGRWVMYVTVTDTGVSDDTFDTAVGVATAPSPAGPWTFADTPVVAPRPGAGGGYLWTIDPSQLTGADGRHWLYYGSYYGGISVTELSPDGLRAVGTPTPVAIDNKFEGAYVLRRDGWYYLFASTANCCAGPATGYSVQVGRSRDPRGPFTDRDGQRLDVSRAGGTPVLTQNGNRWIGTGHNAVLTDLSGQDWIAYHAIDRADPYLDEPFGVNERPMLLDRLDWIDGWPTVNAGAGPSDTARPAPVTTGPVDARFATADLRGWRAGHGRWQAADGVLTGSGTLTSRTRIGGDLRAETDLRLTGAATAGLRLGGVDVRVGHGRLSAGAATTVLPAGLDLGDRHNLAIEVRGRQLVATLSPSRLGDPVARVSLRLPRPGAGELSVRAEGGPAEFDNVSAVRLYRPARHTVPDQRVGPVLRGYSDEFTGGLDPAWRWVRQDPAATVSGGALRWPVQDADLSGTGNTAGVLLRDAPAGNYVAETKVTLDLGEDSVRNYQQAGLVAYVDDDRFARLTQVAIWNTRQVEYGYELPFAGQPVYGGSIVGTPGTTTWLRLAHRVDPVNGEHEFRAGSSRDGKHWTWGAVWTFPADTTPRIGLVAHGGATPAVTAEFDYLRFHR
ncbi:family 43 glycosylhydrolase [Micromonospora aurantiaca]|uniref:family 43 glycosylhydrolase n=1 Tax=Micromonospora TaxID=1873 RepID=UPI0001C43831|nr:MULTISPECIES: family 43 glycosylhydrolase [Micromonospora]ADU10438.1 glycoside hydrolase family 43 [Micromonospora sp. L5]MBC9006375.1 family 43 glycosylhydrolase [Micromonospora aurantiaca]RNI06606.1 glycoside hydrolase family 43 [Micromonospora aurantiaca]SCL24664.1 Glycosyl hydrolases family 43 [Micromonospora aurantiaca]